MPGSTASPTTDSSKAKVTSETNGIFVRPVAVAGIFCPASETASNPPALPEKRRFSTLLGELRPVSVGETPGADDFARRRQSWDTRQKEVPFGQALLRKTPRNPATQPSTDSDHHKNGDGVSVADKSSHDTDVKNSPKTSTDDSLHSVSKTTVTNSTRKDIQDSTSVKHNSDITRKQNDTAVTVSGDKQSKADVSGDHLQQILPSRNTLCKAPDLVNKEKVSSESKSISNDSTKTKKVYGLIKRDSKQETLTVKNDNLYENTAEVSSNSKSFTTKNKVFGLNRTSVKKDVDVEVVDNNTQKANKAIESNDVVTSKIEKLSESKVTTEPSKSGREIFSPSPPKDVRTVRRTSGVIAAKIQNMFSNFQQEKPSPVLPKKTKVSDKVSSPLSKISTQASDNKKEANSSALSSLTNLKSESKIPEVKNGPQNENIPILKTPNIKSTITSKENSNVSLVITNTGSSLQQSDAANAICSGEASQSVKAPLKKDCKSQPSINAEASKQLNKKVDSIEGRMPIKKEAASSSDGTKTFLIPTNQETDRKSPSSTATSSVVMQDVNKNPGAKELASFSNKHTSAPVEEINLKSVPQNVNNFTSSKTTVSQSSTHTVQVSSTSSQSNVSSEICSTISKKSSEFSKLFVNGNAVTTSESSKVEIAKITPTIQSGTVPTVNVLFRTKSPQTTSNKDDNRKKVVIETSSNTAPIASTVLISPKSLDTSQLSNTTKPVNDTIRTVENVQVSLNSSQVPKKHTIVNLQKQEVAAVDLSSSKQPSLGSSCKTENETSCITERNNDKLSATEISPNTDKCLKILPQEQTSASLTYNTKVSSMESIVPSNAPKMEVSNNKSFSSFAGSSVSVVDLNDWNKKFQRIEPEAPRAPLRRRAFRDSLPPSLPLRTLSPFGSGSLKRIEDSARYMPRSPSQSSLPHRYSYTEMLSKVCSMGVLPTVEPVMSKSCSSSSSQVSELWSELSEEQSTATHASEMLESETTERMRLEKEVHELQVRYLSYS